MENNPVLVAGAGLKSGPTKGMDCNRVESTDYKSAPAANMPLSLCVVVPLCLYLYR